jgi:Domain of unknown function (DUF4365)
MTTGNPGRGKAGRRRVPGMRRGHTHVAEDWAVRRVHDVVADELGWNFGRDPLPDYGVDALAEVVSDDELVTGGLLGIQVKGGDSWFPGSGKDGWTFSERSDHLAYWLGYSVPVIVVLVNERREAFWQAVTPEVVSERRGRFRMEVPRSQPFDRTARDALLALVKRGGGVLESLPANYAVLPAAPVGALRRAEADDRLGAARLAERLASGRRKPGLMAASLIAAQPLSIVNSPAAQDLWLAVGAYAEQHGYGAEAGRAFTEAARAPGTRAPLALAAAGMAFMAYDRDAAREHLLRARAEGLVLPADAALSLLDLPEDDWRPPVIPPSVSAATSQELAEWPNVLSFLAEEAVRRRELDKAVGFAERAVECAGVQAGPLKLMLARLVQRRAASGDMSVRQSRRAVRLTREVIDERRLWDGPSWEALAFLLDIQIPTDPAAAVRNALPVSEGGTATDDEAAKPEVASRGALAATITGNTSAYQFFLGQLPDGPHRRELIVLEGEQTGESAAAQIAAWERVLQDPADHAMAAWCVISLARLGHWPAKAEEMHDRSILPDDAYEVLRAIWWCNCGDPALGLATLRGLAETSALAAGELVALIEQMEDAGQAIEECERQAARWQAPALVLRLLDLHSRVGDPERAAELIQKILPDDSFPADVRLGVCTWLAARTGAAGNHAEAAAIAARGLEIGDDQDLAWTLITALFNDGKVTRAREALVRYRPQPTEPGEMRLWMTLHRGIPLTPSEARTMTAIARQQPDGDQRDSTVAVLVREVLLAPPEPAAAHDADIIEEVTWLRDQAAAREGSKLRLVAGDDESLGTALRDNQPDLASSSSLIRDVHDGRKAQADIARHSGKPYGEVLLLRPSLVIPAFDLRPGLRTAGEAAASEALCHGACTADLSSLHLLALLSNDDRVRIRSALPAITIAWPVVIDLIATREDIRNLTVATHTAVLNPDGTIARIPMDSAEQSMLRDQAEALETLASSLNSRRPGIREDAAADAITTAQETGLPLWCDDIALRQTARCTGVKAFSLLDLVTVLAGQGMPLDQASIFGRLAAHYVADLPLSVADMITIAARNGWDAGPAHATLARPAWWQHQGSNWSESWLTIATEARLHSASALTTITAAALTGAVNAVAPSHYTRQHQELAVITLIACHAAGRPAPEGLIDHLATITGPAIAPRPQFIREALERELSRRFGPDACQHAWTLFPEVGAGDDRHHLRS